MIAAGPHWHILAHVKPFLHKYNFFMQGEKKERWRELCEQAAVEQHPIKMLKLITEINHLLTEKEERLVRLRTAPESDKTS
jgi:hypothetical protein